MKTSRLLNFCFVLGLLVLDSCASGPKSSPAQNVLSNPPAHVMPADRVSLEIPAADPRFRYEGRIDFSDTNAPVIIWQASRISIDFSGTAVGLLFADAKGQNFFNAQVDGTNTIIEASAGKPVTPVKLSGFGPGRHHLVLFKRSEAAAGTVCFRGIEIMAATKVWSSPPPVYKLAMEFIGDSITVGACNEDGAADQWTNRLTHNCALSYATLTAEAFDADYRNISVSGMGIATGWVSMKAGEIWDQLYPETHSPPVDLPAWIPNVIFVNFGENDDSFTRAHGQPFPAGFTDGYIALIRAIRTAHPEARIVLLRGGMFGGARSEPLRQAWEAAVKCLEQNDPHISHCVFKHWTKTHPRIADDRIMAGELVDWLKQQPSMQAYARDFQTKD